IAGQDMNFSGANVAARTILIDAGRDLIVASKQNISSNDSFSISASVSFSSSGQGGSFSGSFHNGRRVYTDTPTTIVADEDLTIEVGRRAECCHRAARGFRRSKEPPKCRLSTRECG
ncbi:MAG: hemagglutinin repeat-containing protein, partial [Hyphomicrobiaceae bacterium]|nr:hemagglutinin repeat-containing protein [Hyphomicrobiaceae bacterium]